MLKMFKNKFLQIILFIFLILTSSAALAEEITLFNSSGRAVAYIDTDDELTIYLWQGKPVAYLDSESIYGFNGKHLGWFKDGIIYDHNGYAVGFINGTVSILTQLEPLKGLKQLTPLKSLQQLEPLQPLLKNQWASLPLELFIALGR